MKPILELLFEKHEPFNETIAKHVAFFLQT